MSGADPGALPGAARSNTGRAILAMGVAVLCFDLMTVLIRFLLDRYTAPELSAYRNVLGLVPSLALLIYTGEVRLRGTDLRLRQWPLAVMRGLVVAVAQLLYYAAVGFLELATISTLMQTNAIFAVLLSIVILGDRVGPWRWCAVLLGFAGVVLILRPGSDAFSLYALLPVGAAACYALSMITVRLFDGHVSNGLLYLYASGASAVGAILLAAATTHFTPLQSWLDAGLIFAMGTFGGIGVLLMMLAYRMAAPAVLAPFGYFGILTAFALGWLLFDEAPLGTLFPGVLLIVLSGAVIIWRENRA